MIFYEIWLNVALTHQNMSYSDSATKENVRTQKMKHRWENGRKRTAITKKYQINK